MLNANWVQETTVTAGTGTITLAGADTGFVAFTQVFTDQSVVVYAIENGDNRENGIGTFTTSGTTLARTFVRETLVGGVFDDTAPSAITLSGTSIVYLAPLTDAMDQRMPPISGRFYGSDLQSLNGENQNILLVADDLYLIPFVPAYPGNYDRIALFVDAPLVASNTRMGLYTVDLAGVPVELIVETADMNTGIAGTIAGVISSTHIRRAEYALGILSDSAITVASGGVGTSGSSYLGYDMSFFARQFGWTSQSITPGWSSLPTSGLVIGTGSAARRPITVLRAT